MTQYFKYGRTPHASFSNRKSRFDKDRMLKNEDHFIGMDVVSTEKLDGENTNFYPDYIHYRSLSGRDHISRHLVKQLHASIKDRIPIGYRIVGENLYATHSIHYKELPTYFFVYAVFDEQNYCLSYDDMIYFAKELSLETVPLLYRGKYDVGKVKACYTGKSKFNAPQEGYVVRNANKFHYDDFGMNIFKYVRANNITTNDHWMTQAVVKNELKV